MTTNHQRVTEGFEILTRVLAPFVAQELRRRYEDEWWDQGVRRVLYDTHKRDLPEAGDDEDLVQTLDAARCLIVIDLQWNDVFRAKLSREHRTWVKELITTRNKWAHKGLLDPPDEDAWRALDTMTRMVEQIDSEATEKLRALARTVRYGSEGPSTAAEKPKKQGRRQKKAEETGVLAAAPRQGLKPWRQVVEPHPDVAAGRYRQAEFAADLSQVHRGTAEPEYQDPVEFFARTYLTEGIRGLLLQTLKRVNGTDGEPVIQLKTAFGGGKTHSLLALYHLLRGRAPLEKLAHMAELLKDAGVEEVPQARVAVLVGTAMNPTKERRPPNLPGITVRTMWGEIAAQLAEQAGDLKLFDLVRDADRKGVPPGSDTLRELFDACGPCLILIDELLAYARKIYGAEGLPAGTFDAVLTFVQELTEATRASSNTALVATIPESDIEIGGDAGKKALEHIEHIFGRMEAIWTPVSSEEGFEVVRRRLFLPVADEAGRDDVCRAFGELYRSGHGDFPAECREARYVERMKECYPIHPEVFDRLYNDWATLERFQRTRGVLRLMAAAIHDLWVRQDSSLLIMPGSMGMDTADVRNELTRYLPEGWTPVIESDVDGRRSGPYRLDAENPRFGQAMAARRVTRTVFLGSAPHVAQQQVRGIEDIRLRLGVVQPGEHVSVFNDVLTQLSDQLTHLYRQDRRYWYDTRPNLRRTVRDRAQQLSGDDVEMEVERRLRAARERGDFAAVHVCPQSGDLPDEREARLVVLGPAQAHKANEDGSAALAAAAEILDHRGNAPRQFRNMVVFVAPDLNAIEALKDSVRQFLAWKSVVADHEALNLDANQRREAAEDEKRSDQTVQLRLEEAYSWLLMPTQEGSNSLEWEAVRIAGSDSHIKRASNRLRTSDQLITKWSPALLKMELDRWFWKDADHVGIHRVWAAMCSYCYLPRLRDEMVFIAAVQEGVAGGDYFAYATSVSDDGRYEGLRLGTPSVTIFMDDAAVLVKPDIAKAQLDAEQLKPKPAPGETPRPGPEPAAGPEPLEGELPKRFFATVEVDANRAGRDVGKIAEEVLQHLTTLPGAKVKVTVEIEAEAPDGVSEEVQRVVNENCQTLKFKDHGFEKS